MFDNLILKIKLVKSLWSTLYGSKTKRIIKIAKLRKLLDKYEQVLVNKKKTNRT